MTTLEALYATKRFLEDQIDELETEGPNDTPRDPGGKKLALVVGHTARSPGAYSRFMGESEYFWNQDLANRIKRHSDITVGIFYRDVGGIAGAYKRVKEWGPPAAVIELHFNAATPAATGTETIYVTGRSRPFAEAIQAAMVSVLKLRDRGIKKPYQGRGNQSLTSVPIPSIIIEPFFGSNNGDANAAQGNKEKLGKAIAEASNKFIKEN